MGSGSQPIGGGGPGTADGPTGGGGRTQPVTHHPKPPPPPRDPCAHQHCVVPPGPKGLPYFALPVSLTSVSGAVAVGEDLALDAGGWVIDEAVNGLTDLLGTSNDPEPEPEPEPETDTGPDSRRSDPCSAKREDRFNYEPALDGAPTGVTALLCPQDLKPPNSRGPRKGRWEPPGYVSRKDRGGNWIFNRSHILGDRFHGDWRKENIFTGFREMNDPDMKACENEMADALAARQEVYYSGQLLYANGRKNLPTAIQMTAVTSKGILFDVTVKNAPGKQVTC